MGFKTAPSSLFSRSDSEKERYFLLEFEINLIGLGMTIHLMLSKIKSYSIKQPDDKCHDFKI